ncbi:unnamed protein product [Anisakis simplex]|uniref:MFS domain-containing protein n=1 Tax=Anisakis simplex TaxID=6269 RepID=A0A158PPB7_ANISI|nr:unnamed protein product [Anisakis simplex]
MADFARLNANRFHILMFILWQIALLFCAQQIFPIFYDYYPNRKCDDTYGAGVWNISSDDCMPIHSEQCVLLQKCHNISLLHVDFHGIVEYFGLYCGQQSYSSTLVSTLQFIGVLCGTITYGHLGDYFGRKAVSLFGITVGMICGIVSGLSVSWQMFAVLRFFVGTSIACVLVVFYTYVLELILPEQRVFLRSFFNWGYARLIFTLVCFLLPHWRVASIVTSVLISPLIPIIAFLLPETPKWYTSKQRFEHAERAYKRVNWISGQQDTETISAEHLRAEFESADKRVYTIMNLLSNRQLASRTVVMCVLWFATSLSAFGSDLNSGNLGGNFYLNQFIMSLAIAFSKIAIYILDSLIPKFSRRLLHQIPQGLMVCCYASIMFIMIFGESAKCEEKSNSPTDIAIGVSLIEITWDACYLCAVESFPTEVRSIGMGTCSLLARIGALIAPQMAYMSSYYKAAPYILVVVIGLISFIVSIVFLRDTKGVELVGLLGTTKSNQSVAKDFSTATTISALECDFKLNENCTKETE